jgi:molybdate transport system substrate-binding protein
MLRALLATFLFGALPAQAGEVSVAVAANFTEPAKEIAAVFEKKTGHKVTMSFASSAAVYAQIQQGAPFEVFLSADAERPTRLETEGFGVAGTRFVYAYGALVLWSAKPGFIDAKGAVLRSGKFNHIAIADPASAPYGVAAIETMKKLGLSDALAPKIVKGTSIAKAYAFVDTGAAELGFIALSQVKKTAKGSYWLVPKDYYTPIDQQAILLKTGANDPAARAYIDFLKSPQAVAITRSYGYEVR